ncbi:hypothetical protein HLI_13900 [Halobacillus litoralis]|uniref:Uncharacterized protein n=1 Tax=Halobacillus litoralis TaxID=45668 RepID=A0A410MEN7_9BACI|nr:hypothetical protein HLI_13900 [Halobacillus litoralis]
MWLTCLFLTKDRSFNISYSKQILFNRNEKYKQAPAYEKAFCPSKGLLKTSRGLALALELDGAYIAFDIH